MTVSVQGFTLLVENAVAAIQGACSTLLDFTIGSILRCMVEAFSGSGLFYQAQALQVATLTRAATSNGPDLDSFYADFGFTRLPANGSTGSLTFSRFSTTGTVNLPVGTQAQTFDGSQQFTVIADSTNAAYNSATNAYVLNSGVGSLTVAAVATSVGSASNVSANTITQIITVVPGIDTVTNTSAFSGGEDPETDAAFRVRFVQYIASLSKATNAAIGYAISSVQSGLTYDIVEDQTYSGSARYGYFYVVVDDGSGAPSGTLLSSVGTAIDLTRACGIPFDVYAPVIVYANVAATITATGTLSVAEAAATAALTSYINSLPLGTTTLPYTRLAQVIYGASTAITNVTGVTLNSGTSDLTLTNQNVVKLGTVSIT